MTGSKRKRGKTPSPGYAHEQRWEFSVYTGKKKPNGSPDRKTRAFTGDDRSSDKALAEFVREVERGLLLDLRLTVAAYGAQWYAEKAREGLAGKTLARYETIVRCYITPTLGALPLAKVEPKHLRDALHEWRIAPRKDRKRTGTASESTIHHAWALLSNMLDTAVIDKKMKENPCKSLKKAQRPHEATPPIIAADVDTALDMIEALRDTAVGDETMLAACSGLRAGEMLGLPWGNVDLDRGVVRVVQVCEQVRDADGKPRARIRPYPKTRGSLRDVYLLPQAVGLLRRRKSAYNGALLKAGLSAAPEHLVFPNPNLSIERSGFPWDPLVPWLPDEFSAAFYYRVGKTGLPRISFKNLCRTTFATLNADAGTRVEVVQKLLGHSSLTTTMKHYVAVLDSAKAEAAANLGAYFDRHQERRAAAKGRR